MTRIRATRCHHLLILLALSGFACAGIEAAPGPAFSQPSDSTDSTVQAAKRVGFLVVDGVYNTELIAPYDVFEHARHHDSQGRGLEVFTVSPDGAEVTTAEGLRIRPDYSFANVPPIDILVVPSARGSRDSDLEKTELIEWVATTGRSAETVMSLCWGAFVLAKAGLLEGRASTTFPDDYALFATTFPSLDVRFNVSFVHDRDRLTSQGGARSYEAAMYLVDQIFGEEVAAGVGRGLLIPWPPAPGERPFIVRTMPFGE